MTARGYMHIMRFGGIRAWKFLVIALLLALPIYGPVMPAVEGWLLPVTTKIAPVNLVADGEGMDFRFQFTKMRACEYLGTEARMAGYHLEFYQKVDPGGHSTRMVGAQTSNLWHLNAKTLDGVTIWFIHRCSPLWLTYTLAYP